MKETKKLLRLIQRYTKSRFVDEGLAEIKLEPEQGKKKRSSSKNPNFQPDQVMKIVSSYIDFEEAKMIDWEGLPWTKIARKMKTRSKDDCRNRL